MRNIPGSKPSESSNAGTPPQVGDTQVRNGVKLRFNENHRWELDEDGDAVGDNTENDPQYDPIDQNVSGGPVKPPVAEHSVRHAIVSQHLSSVNQNVGGVIRALHTHPDYQSGNDVATHDLHPHQAVKTYQWLKQNIGQTAGGDTIVDLGQGRLGFASKAGSFFMWPPGANGKQKVAYTTNTDIVNGLAGGGQPGNDDPNDPETIIGVEDEGDSISGGLADNVPAGQFSQDSIQQGEKVELEHTNDPKIAQEIARDHLSEDPNYYDKLAKMEGKTPSNQLDVSRKKSALAEEAALARLGLDKLPKQTSKELRERDVAKLDERNKEQPQPLLDEKSATPAPEAKPQPEATASRPQIGRGLTDEGERLFEEAVRKMNARRKAREDRMSGRVPATSPADKPGYPETPAAESPAAESPTAESPIAESESSSSAPASQRPVYIPKKNLDAWSKGLKPSYVKAVNGRANKFDLLPKEYHEYANQVWEGEGYDLHNMREEAKAYARRLTGMTQKDINRLENKNLDYGSKTLSKKNLDVWGEEIARQYPELGWEGRDNLDEMVWELIREGKKKKIERTSREFLSQVDDFVNEIMRAKDREEEGFDDPGFSDSGNSGRSPIPFRRRANDLYIQYRYRREVSLAGR